MYRLDKKPKVYTGLFVGTLLFSIALQAEPLRVMPTPQPRNSDEVQLGKKLFHSKKLSSNDTVSCASCHDISAGGDDGAPVSVGVNNQKGGINSPSVLNSYMDIAQFWDGRASSQEAQVEGPIHNPVEMDSNWNEVISKLSKDKNFVIHFKEVYGSGINEENIASAIAAYESQLATLNSPFDQFLKGDFNAITEIAKEGYRLFKTMGCVSCHQGKNIGGNMYQKFGVIGDYFKDRGNITEFDYGRYNATGREIDRYKFKVPSLRNVADTAPYFHDGSAQTLDSAVRIMAKYQLGRPISRKQIYAITEFLNTLTGDVDAELLP